MKHGIIIISALCFFVLSTQVRAGDSFEYAFRGGDEILYDVKVSSGNVREFRSFKDPGKVAGVESDVQKKTYYALLTVLSVGESGDCEVALRIMEPYVLNTRTAADGTVKYDRSTGKEKEGELCKAVVDKSGRILKFLSGAGGRNKELLERVIVLVTTGSGSGAGKEAFTLHPIENKGLKSGNADARGKGSIKYEAEGRSSCRSGEEELGRKNEEINVREKRTVYLDKALGVMTSHSYTWDYVNRYNTSYARVKEKRYISVQVNAAK